MKTVAFTLDHRGMRNAAPGDRITQLALRREIAARAGLSVTATQVRGVTLALVDDLTGAMKPRGARWRLPGLFTVIRRDIPARRAGKRLNPFTGVMAPAAAQPASARYRVKLDRRWRELWLWPYRVTFSRPLQTPGGAIQTGNVHVPTSRKPAQEARRPQGTRALVAALSASLPAMSTEQIDAVLRAMRLVLAEHVACEGVVTLKGLVRIGRSVRPARPAGVRFVALTKKLVDAPAAPARIDARARLSGGLKKSLQATR